jgi:16S rRNA G966 N2-methylase RsmD
VRIISGKYKSKRIFAPKDLSIRPTTDIAKEALFNILENRFFLNQKKILDLFSGTGNISYEFASRGCDELTAVDQNYQCVKFINDMSKQKFDIIFADPPYNYNYYNKLKKIILDKNLLVKDGCLIIEHNSNTSFDDQDMELRKYGNVHFSIFTK